jgi:hypothetical protein
LELASALRHQLLGELVTLMLLLQHEQQSLLPVAFQTLCNLLLGGSEFINWHLKSWCERKQIQLTRGRPYKKDDNAHIEQKNWTHVRKLLGWDRYDTHEAVEAINHLYRNELRL